MGGTLLPFKNRDRPSFKRQLLIFLDKSHFLLQREQAYLLSTACRNIILRLTFW
jgi:hypothetical protein